MRGRSQRPRVSRYWNGFLDAEYLHDAIQFVRLGLSLLDGGVGLLNQGSILLGDFIDCADSLADLFDRDRLFSAFSGYSSQQDAIFLHMLKNCPQTTRRLVQETGP